MAVGLGLVVVGWVNVGSVFATELAGADAEGDGETTAVGIGVVIATAVVGVMGKGVVGNAVGTLAASSPELELRK